MKQDKTLLKIVQKLQRKELIRYASNLGLEFDEKWDISKLRKAYTEFVLSHPKELLLMLPKADLDIIRKAKDGKAGEGVDRVNNHLTPIMVLYGLADMELLQEDFATITIAEDLRLLLIPHIDWALEYEHNQQRMSVEIIVEGLANILGIVTQNEIGKYLKLLMQNDDNEEAMKAFEIIRQYSLLLDSMEYAEDLENAEDEDIRFVSRYGWEDKRKMEQFIAQHSKKIDSVREFSLEELTKASGILFPFIPNPKMGEFMHFLTCQIGLNEANAHIVCFNLWYYKIHYGEYALDDMPMELHFLSYALTAGKQEPTDRLAEEGMLRLADFANNIPLWHLRGFTAADYPAEAFVPKLSTKEPLGPMLRKLKKEAYLMTDILNGKTPLPNQAKSSMEDNPWAGQKIGRNDPCPCGSGLKYKKCHGKGL
jgi:hypothetical protein